NFFGASGGTTTGTPYAGQVNLIQPVYQGGRIKALKRQAKAGIMAARAGLDNAENNIFLSAANAYVDVLRDEEAASIRRNNVRVLQRQLTAANDRFDVGEGTRTDIAQSESRLAAAEAGLAQADAQLEISRALFVRIVGRMPNQLQPVPDFVLPQSLEEATRLARENNPQLLAAYYNELAGDAAIDVARAAGRPSLSLQGSLVASRDTILGIEETDQATIGAQLSIPIFSGGLNRSRVRQAEHARTRLSFESRDTERAVDQTIAQVWAQMQAARQIVQTSARQVAAAEIAFEGVTLEQQVGTRTQLDVLDAEQETLNARLNLINAERDLDAAIFQLLSVIGVFDADGITLPIQGYDPDIYLSSVAYDGFKEAGDRFIPEALQKIGKQAPNIVKDPVRTVIGGADALALDERADGLGERLQELGGAVKEGVDVLTFQTPHYDPRITDPDVAILTQSDPVEAGLVADPDAVLSLNPDELPDDQIDEHAEPDTVMTLPETP
ncbi:MAG: TolC family outer membrane protein, partial [Pseudomonadota bacterium]